MRLRGLSKELRERISLSGQKNRFRDRFNNLPTYEILESLDAFFVEAETMLKYYKSARRDLIKHHFRYTMNHLRLFREANKEISTKVRIVIDRMPHENKILNLQTAKKLHKEGHRDEAIAIARKLGVDLFDFIKPVKRAPTVKPIEVKLTDRLKKLTDPDNEKKYYYYLNISNNDTKRITTAPLNGWATPYSLKCVRVKDIKPNFSFDAMEVGQVFKTKLYLFKIVEIIKRPMHMMTSQEVAKEEKAKAKALRDKATLKKKIQRRKKEELAKIAKDKARERKKFLTKKRRNNARAAKKKLLNKTKEIIRRRPRSWSGVWNISEVKQMMQNDKEGNLE